MTWTCRSFAPLLGFLLAALVTCSHVTHAQLAPQLQGPQETEQGAQEPPVSEADLRELVETLRDESQRQELIRQLEALIAARGEQAEAAPLPEDPVGWMLEEISRRTNVVRDLAQSVADALDRVPQLLAWLEAELSDPTTREIWLWITLHVVLVLGAGATAMVAASVALRGLRSRLAPARALTLLGRLPRVLLWLLIELLPVLAFAIGAYGVLGLFSVHDLSRLVARPLITAVIIVRTGVAVIKVLFAPKMPELRLFPMSDETARLATRWSRRLFALSVYGYYTLLAARQLGLPWALHELLLHLLYLCVSLMAMTAILQMREPVARAIASLGEESRSAALRRLPWQGLAGIWHILAMLYVIFIYLVWALRVPGGFRFLLGATIGSVLILIAGWIGWRALDQIFGRELPVGEDGGRIIPGLERRARRYWPLVGALARGLLLLILALGLLQVWGLGALSWLFSEAGNTVLGHLLTAATIVLITIVVWELISFLIERAVGEQTEDGDLKLSNRTRTLLNIARNFVLVFLSLIALFLILSELGLNIAPLLAGAGVIGLAIGFGSQRLVQDIITGMFMLVGDTIRVGDVVEVAGRSGVVEAVTMRTVQLRDYGGNVHTIPYSAIDTVTNLTKEFSYALFDFGVAYRENVDEVMDVLRGLGEEMNRDPHFRRLILEPLEIAGVDKFAPSAVIIKARFKTRPLKQWEVSREFLRRVKNRFDQLGIEIPYPHQTLYFGADKEGKAPPARVEIVHAPPTAQPVAAEPDQQPEQTVLAQSRSG